jgi:hypothetical protein
VPKITGTGVASISGAASAASGVKAKGDSPEPQNAAPRVHALSAPPAPQAGVDKWLAYATLIGIDVPEESREDKAAIRSLVDDK